MAKQRSVSSMKPSKRGKNRKPAARRTRPVHELWNVDEPVEKKKRKRKQGKSKR